MTNNIEQNTQRIKRLRLSCTLNDNGKERYFHHGHEYVEIGGIKWATMNIGAETITDYGLYFQWGDAQGYTAEQVGKNNGRKIFGWVDYKFNPSGNGSTFTKYTSSDGKTVLDIEDPARVNWGGQWRMPTTEELQALGAAVDAVWIKNYQGSDVNGVLCVDKTDKSKVLFFPAVGRCINGSVYSVGEECLYWSNTLDNDPVFAWRIVNKYFVLTNSRCFGFAVRGVFG